MIRNGKQNTTLILLHKYLPLRIFALFCRRNYHLSSTGLCHWMYLFFLRQNPFLERLFFSCQECIAHSDLKWNRFYYSGEIHRLNFAKLKSYKSYLVGEVFLFLYIWYKNLWLCTYHLDHLEVYSSFVWCLFVYFRSGI